MTRTVIVSTFASFVLIGGIGAWANAQQAAPQEDAEVTTYKFLLGEANDRIAKQSKQIMVLDGKVKAFEAEKTKADKPIDKPAVPVVPEKH